MFLCIHLKVLAEEPTVILTHYVEFESLPLAMNRSVTWLRNVTKKGFEYCFDDSLFSKGATKIEIVSATNNVFILDPMFTQWGP